MSSEGNKGRSGLVIGVLAVGVLALGVLLYLRSEEKHALELDKQELTVELSGLKEDLMGQIGENDSLNSFIETETARLGLLIDSINAVNVDNKKQLTNYRYRLSSLKKQNAELVEQLDSTNEAYAALKMRAMQCHAVHRRGHTMFTDPPVDITTITVISVKNTHIFGFCIV